MSKAIENQIRKIYKTVFAKVYTKSRLQQLLRGDRMAILRAAEVLETAPSYDKFAEKFAKELAKKGLASRRGIWRKYYEAARKVHYVGIPKTWAKFEAEQLSKVVKHNFTMIKTIPRKAVEVMEHKYTSTLIEEVAKGKLPRGSFYKELNAHGAKNAKVIARTETAKLQTAITENRATDLGSVAYVWFASNDKRTRPSHKAMNNVIVFWREGLEKPLLDGMYGNAGEFPNCRCSPEPIFDETDLTNSNYKVYDYTQHKIVNMSKKELLDKLAKGHL